MIMFLFWFSMLIIRISSFILSLPLVYKQYNSLSHICIIIMFVVHCYIIIIRISNFVDALEMSTKIFSTFGRCQQRSFLSYHHIFGRWYLFGKSCKSPSSLLINNVVRFGPLLIVVNITIFKMLMLGRDFHTFLQRMLC